MSHADDSGTGSSGTATALVPVSVSAWEQPSITWTDAVTTGIVSQPQANPEAGACRTRAL
ncbi:hypothetical protein J1792_24565 [Streptomyces triculaminicus]|uniref:Uncharacterized protein n=1 Tax=Streptomyces triculaminicus TaxID=2816232 RepID=A0A939FTS1_9ACTN|nr:hypothetical protein [Streptomyces triculaminicus]MBO0655837.1 hypothetical protein [Streptomyces triculaminicus]